MLFLFSTDILFFIFWISNLAQDPNTIFLSNKSGEGTMKLLTQRAIRFNFLMLTLCTTDIFILSIEKKFWNFGNTLPSTKIIWGDNSSIFFLIISI